MLVQLSIKYSNVDVFDDTDVYNMVWDDVVTFARDEYHIPGAPELNSVPYDYIMERMQNFTPPNQHR